MTTYSNRTDLTLEAQELLVRGERIKRILTVSLLIPVEKGS